MIGKKKPVNKEADLRLEQKNLLTENSNFFIREAYKTLRTNVSFALTEAEGCKVIVVTSSMQGEGKSSTATNLAISYAMADSNVLIIDCDLRRPKLSRLLQLNAKAGLSNLLLKPELLPEVILSGPVEGLDVILAGDVPPNPSELLGSSRIPYYFLPGTKLWQRHYCDPLPGRQSSDQRCPQAFGETLCNDAGRPRGSESCC